MVLLVAHHSLAHGQWLCGCGKSRADQGPVGTSVGSNIQYFKRELNTILVYKTKRKTKQKRRVFFIWLLYIWLARKLTIIRTRSFIDLFISRIRLFLINMNSQLHLLLSFRLIDFLIYIWIKMIVLGRLLFYSFICNWTFMHSAFKRKKKPKWWIENWFF